MTATDPVLALVKAIQVETTVDEAAASVIPALRPPLGKRIELIALLIHVRRA